jgi:hypothetical protein
MNSDGNQMPTFMEIRMTLCGNERGKDANDAVNNGAYAKAARIGSPIFRFSMSGVPLAGAKSSRVA